MDRTYGRAPSGVRVDGPVPHGHWKVTTLAAAVRLCGLPESACLAFDGATDSACFETYGAAPIDAAAHTPRDRRRAEAGGADGRVGRRARPVGHRRLAALPSAEGSRSTGVASDGPGGARA